MDSPMTRRVGAEIDVNVLEASTLEYQITVARHDDVDLDEELVVTVDGDRVEPVELIGEHGTRIHQLEAPVSTVKVRYSATVRGRTPPPAVSDIDLITYLRQSRYAESDKFFGFAATEFGRFSDTKAVLDKVSSWVGSRLCYVPGSSDPIDGATDTLLAGRGVCRDYAHLVIALLRAVNVPARLAAVYAPGCYPMDFHAVAEAFVDGHWYVVDATRLAPRPSMLRIATGRDAADTAFLDNHGGSINMTRMNVTAIVDGGLPSDLLADRVSLG